MMPSERQKIYPSKSKDHSMNTTCDLSKKHCVPCQGGVSPLKGELLTQLQHQLGGGWTRDLSWYAWSMSQPEGISCLKPLSHREIRLKTDRLKSQWLTVDERGDNTICPSLSDVRNAAGQFPFHFRRTQQSKQRIELTTRFVSRRFASWIKKEKC